MNKCFHDRLLRKTECRISANCLFFFFRSMGRAVQGTCMFRRSGWVRQVQVRRGLCGECRRCRCLAATGYHCQTVLAVAKGEVQVAVFFLFALLRSSVTWCRLFCVIDSMYCINIVVIISEVCNMPHNIWYAGAYLLAGF